MWPDAQIPTIYPEQFRKRYVMNDPAVDFSQPNFNLFYIQRVEDSCKFLKLPTPPHRSTTHELLLLTSGHIKRNVGVDGFEVSKNNAFFLPAGQITTVDFISSDAKGFYCHFDASVLIRKFINLHLINEFEFLRSVSNPITELLPESIVNLTHLFSRIVDEHRKGNSDLVQSYLFTILLEIKQHQHTDYRPDISPAHYLTSEFKKLVASHFKSFQKTADYAAILNVSTNHLTRTVKAVTGKAPTQHINELVILEAKVLLHQSHLSVSNISYSLGIEDPSYFSRLFKRHTGLSPSEFRKQLINKKLK